MRAAIVIGLVVAASQGAGPSFEVTSVRANTGADTAYSMRWSPDGRFRATNITPRRLIALAYDLRTDNQLMGEPRWIASERFDIEAVPAVLVPRPQQRLMLQALLRDRFGLVMRAQPVDVPIYALVRTRPDAPLPRTLRESTVTCTRVRWDPLTERPPTGGDPACAGVRLESGRIVSASGQLPTLAAMLRSVAGRRVLDRTGLTGRYDFEVTWFMDPLAGNDVVMANAGIFAAIQELGLKLEPALSPEAGYVIERIQRPTPN